MTPDVSTLEAHGGSFSAQLGAIGLPEPNGDSWIYQTVTVPASLQSPTLSFWFWPASLDSIGYDWQEAQIRDTSGNMLAQVLKVASNTQAWTYSSFDLTPYKGQTVQLYFNVHEDGDSYGYITSLYLDDVTIGEGSPALRFVPITPCRVVDTRGAHGAFGGPAISGGTSRDFAIPQGGCSIPATARAYALNATVVPHGPLSYLTVWPTGATRPVVSTLNSPDGRTKANATITPAGTYQAVSVYASNTTDVVLDISGYFVQDSSAYAFFPLTPCRVVDTRNANNPLGGPALQNGQQRDFPVLQATACNIPSSAQAYSFNVTALPQRGQPLGYVTTWPAGSSRPVVSTLNAPTGTNTANAAIVPAGTGGDIMAYASGNNTDLIIDINGYFAPANSRRESHVAVQSDAVSRAGYAAGSSGHSLHRRAHGECCGQSLLGALERHQLCAECDRGAQRPAWVSDIVARRTASAAGFNLERRRRSHHLQHGDRANRKRLSRRVYRRADATDPRHLELFRALNPRSLCTSGNRWTVPAPASFPAVNVWQPQNSHLRA